MNNGIPALVANAHHGEAQAVQAPEQQLPAAPQLPPAGLQQGQGLGLQPLGQNRHLERLPQDQLRNVVAYLQDGHDMVRNINALANLSKTRILHNAIIAIPPGSDVLSKFHLMDRPMQAIDRCLSELAELCNPQPVPYFLGCGPILGLLPPDLRAQLVQGAISINNLTLRGEAIAELAAGTGELSQEDCSSLFHAAVDIFHGNGNGSPFERIYGTAVVLAGLLEGPNFLEQERREEIINFATALVEMGANRFNNASIDGLGKAIRFLPDHVRGSLVGRVTNAADSEERSLSLANLGFAVSTVPDLDVFGHAIEAALHLEELEELEDVECRAAAIGGLAAAMVSMEPMLRQNFVIVALNFFNEPLSSEVACKLGAAAEFLSDNERNTLVNLATVPSANPFHGPTALADHQFCLSTRVGGLAAGMAFLTVPQRQALVQTALGLSDIEAKAEAIGAMGQGLQHLHAAQRNELVDAALTFGDNNNIPNLTAITGLGAGARYLDKTQRNRLIDTVISIIETDPDAVRETSIAKLSALSAIAASVSTEI